MKKSGQYYKMIHAVLLPMVSFVVFSVFVVAYGTLLGYVVVVFLPDCFSCYLHVQLLHQQWMTASGMKPSQRTPARMSSLCILYMESNYILDEDRADRCCCLLESLLLSHSLEFPPTQILHPQHFVSRSCPTYNSSDFQLITNYSYVTS